VNPIEDLITSAPADSLALISLSAEGERREWSFGEIADCAARLSGRLAELGVIKGDTVMTLVGNRPEWVISMVAIWRMGAVALPCSEMLRGKDLELRIAATDPALIICDERNLPELAKASGDRAVLTIPAEDLFSSAPQVAPDLSPEDPATVIFTSGTTSQPEGIVHGQRWLAGQALQAKSWFGAQAGTLAWCTAAPGWSKSSRNTFLAPWLCGAAALIHDRRFDPDERVAIIERESVATLCQAPTEYRIIARRAKLRPFPALKSMLAAGEALGAEVVNLFHEATGVWIRDGYGQTETSHLTGFAPDETPVPGSMGRALPGVKLWVEDGELVVDPKTVPTFFTSRVDGSRATLDEPWRTGDLVREEDGLYFFEGRADDIIASAGYRIGPLEVEEALETHPGVVESAVVGEPDEERGNVVRAVVVLHEGVKPSDALAEEIKAHVREITAPYKYPRIIDFADDLPRTTTGKIQRSALRKQTNDS